MEREQGIPIDRPEIILNSTLGNKDKLRLLTTLSESNEKEYLLDDISNEISNLDEEENQRLVESIFDGLKKDDEEWDVNKRDGALEILGLVDFSKFGREKLRDIYLSAVDSQNEDSDPYGSIYSLLDAGKTIARYLPTGMISRNMVTNYWNKVSWNFEQEDREFIKEQSNQVISELPLNQEDLLGDPGVNLGGREKPNFGPSEQVLHENYLEVTNNSNTFKIFLWENTVQYRLLCKSFGIDLERFWNIKDPDLIIFSLRNIDWNEFPQAKDEFNKSLKSKIGLDLDSLTPEHARVVADEIAVSADNAKNNILNNIGDFDSVISRFKVLIDQVQDKSDRAKRQLARQISNFFNQNGIDTDNTPGLDQLSSFLENIELIDMARSTYEEKQKEKVESARMLEKSFDLSSNDKDFSLISREKADLYLGDLTGDCTAYHLYTGINAWTVPTWLSDPGFNIYKIKDTDKLIAKLGIMLSESDGKPMLTVDSFEVGSGLQDEESAKEKIKEGLSRLRAWSKQIGLKDVLINTVSNSSGATELLKDLNISEELGNLNLYKMGGLSGLSELRNNISNQTIDEHVYLQSSSFDNDEQLLIDEQSGYVRRLEDLINSTIEKAEHGKKEDISSYANSQDWEKLFGSIVEVNFPNINKMLGTDWNKYKRFVEFLEIDEIGSIRNMKTDSNFDDEQLPVSVAVQEKMLEELALNETEFDDDFFYENQSLIEADLLDEFMIEIKKMENVDLTPELALERLYSRTNTDLSKSLQVKLNNYLPKLII